MKINSYNTRQYINTDEQSTINKNKNVNKEDMNSNINTIDSIEISENSKQISIKNKIESGFYDNPNILKKVAEKILITINTK